MIDREQAIEAATVRLPGHNPISRLWAEDIVDAILALPPQVSDEMVERGCERLWQLGERLSRQEMRAALVAALSLRRLVVVTDEMVDRFIAWEHAHPLGMERDERAADSCCSCGCFVSEGGAMSQEKPRNACPECAEAWRSNEEQRRGLCDECYGDWERMTEHMGRAYLREER